MGAMAGMQVKAGARCSFNRSEFLGRMASPTFLAERIDAGMRPGRIVTPGIPSDQHFWVRLSRVTDAVVPRFIQNWCSIWRARQDSNL
jgi:hypothetical protein